MTWYEFGVMKKAYEFINSQTSVSSLFFYFARKINILAEAGWQLPGLEFLPGCAGRQVCYFFVKKKVKEKALCDPAGVGFPVWYYLL